MMIRRLILALFLCTLLYPVNAHARTVHVDSKATQPGDGSSWASAMQELDQALASAADGDQIWVAEGVYTPNPSAGRAATFKLVPGVEIYGGFSGTEVELGKRNFKKHQTTLSGDIGQMGVPDDNVFHVVTGADRAVLDGFTVTGGYSRNARWQGGDQLTASVIVSGPGNGQGAGMINFQASPEVRNCVFQDNQALEGGAVYNMTSPSNDPTGVPETSPRFIDCTFWQNSAMAYGGGVANALRTKPLFVSCEFDSNLSDFKGGGMYNDFGAAPILLNSIFRNNEAVHGGGMANDGGAAPIFYYCTLTGNRSTKDGPAIHQGDTSANTTILIKTVVWANECECKDTRFLNGPGSEIRVQDSVIQGGYKGKSVFQANPSLDRKSETMLNVGYKTNGFRFTADKLDARIKDANRSEFTQNLPSFDSGYTAAVTTALLDTRNAPALPETRSIPVQLPEVAQTPAPQSIATPEPEPEQPKILEQPQVLEQAPKQAPVATPEPVLAPVQPPAPQPEPDALAMVEPQHSVLKESPAPRKSGPKSSEIMLLELDADGNGCITINEAQGPLQQQFWRVDHNGDGCLSKAELDRMDDKSRQEGQDTAEQASQPQPRPQPRPVAQQAKPAAPQPTTTASLAKPQTAAPAKTTALPAASKAESSGSSTGYTLFAPIGGTETYLVDMQGSIFKKWTSKDTSAGAVYLLNNGNLLRTVSPAKGEVRTPFEGKGVNGGIIQEVSPRGQIVWEYSYVSSDVRQHHDVEPLPNGNVLLLAWEMKHASDIEAAGGSLRSHPEGKLWVEHIVEVRKSGPRSGYIVWEWHAWDHLVQDSNQSAPNYASPVRLPQRIDLNYNPTRQADWQHANSIDFNPALNQIVVSLRNTNEIWIIDHSTSTAQAAASSGGLMRRGGDILFRWGNPAAYGASGRPSLMGQHDAQWIPNGKPGDETILIFNNGDRREKRSDIIEIKPEYYFKTTRLNAQVVWSYNDAGGSPFFADHVSGAQRLANGNTLICDGTDARIFEVTGDAKPVWEYKHEGRNKGPDSHLFRATRIPSDHPGIKRLSSQ
ncbi:MULTISPECIES: aryl-sulfate sulfotransferase [unclassified Pseudodesulfovibrio]|uniref:aryl-sulfate sulfotransferase n=1 Tax=unclassified Pseudodesulfovibrio TaxID=2661612 RepID=UPI000FEBE5B4|nr:MULTISPECIES: aryl-sulfate sulfotransferase [unclassified Pseudodesulfovibrio]MCJ2164290.1 aryl-sulfate sulfotransferase [Pseudodesulfovibrio sp. S3-i]RWU04501.1 hypothetical protein DWB63_07015 [Pseudodesulfovibrio sp. S3]